MAYPVAQRTLEVCNSNGLAPPSSARNLDGDAQKSYCLDPIGVCCRRHGVPRANPRRPDPLFVLHPALSRNPGARHPPPLTLVRLARAGYVSALRASRLIPWRLRYE